MTHSYTFNKINLRKSFGIVGDENEKKNRTFLRIQFDIVICSYKNYNGSDAEISANFFIGRNSPADLSTMWTFIFRKLSAISREKETKMENVTFVTFCHGKTDGVLNQN